MTNELLYGAVSAILGGGVMRAWVAYRKLRPESDELIVNSARQVVVMSTDVLAEQRRQIAEQRLQIDDLRAQMASVEARLSTELASERQVRRAAEVALEVAEARNRELLVRVSHLESEAVQLRAEVAELRAELSGGRNP